MNLERLSCSLVPFLQFLLDIRLTGGRHQGGNRCPVAVECSHVSQPDRHFDYGRSRPYRYRYFPVEELG